MKPGNAERNAYEIRNDNIRLEGFKVVGAENAAGISISRSDGVVVGNNISENNRYGIFLHRPSNNLVENNIAKYNTRKGIWLSGPCENNTIRNNLAVNNGHSGFLLFKSCSGNLLENNTSRNNWDGFSLGVCAGNTLRSNLAENNGVDGFRIKASDNNILNNNVAENNRYRGFHIHDNSSGNLLENNYAENNKWLGISVGGWVTVDDNSEWGIINSHYNVIKNNILENHSTAGIAFYFTTNNVLKNNLVENNRKGIYLRGSSNNQIYHNNFLSNTTQAFDNGSNTWDNGYPSGGNYWSDYTDEDNYHGENQDIPGSDGIGDTPYSIPGDSNQDRYPLMEPWPSEITAEHLFSADDYYLFNPGRYVQYSVSESEGNLDAVMEVACQDSSTGIHYITLTQIGEEGGYWRNSAIFREKRNDKIVWLAGCPVGNQSHFFAMLLTMPSTFQDEDSWVGSWHGESDYTVNWIGTHTVNGVEYDNCIRITISRTKSESEYLRGEGQVYLSKGIGVVEYIFQRTNGNVFTARILESGRLSPVTISGKVIQDGSPVEGYGVSTSFCGLDKINSFATDSEGNFSFDIYGHSIVLRYGPIVEGETRLDVENSKEYKIDNIETDITGLKLIL
ncbi:hypothetical protein AKJ65_03985 [candidate division MSBL1 archaeon SCGC-AAA259E19]|uniref:Periplasmic copper-binding protein NosD beta helix domain-containing protein n=1 Tax=candidate division MSBL1 archaeon SCGC-AAA259E19 TaxID=1698264 RepID=A0A133UK61_9EURY|nr:hypothetical protein AKJ65_03985 [candidate division MSBL1 archaeon SCGC-AAA259E19]